MKIITQTPPQIKLIAVTLEYDRCNCRQVYAVIKQFYPHLSAKDWTPELITPFIAEGADASEFGVLKTLRNVEHNLNKPPKKTKKRSRCNQPRPGHNYAAEVTRRITFDALMEVS